MYLKSVLGPVLQHRGVLFDQSLLKSSTSPESTWPWVTPAGALNLNNSTERIAGMHKPFHHVQGHWSCLLQIMHQSSPWMESGQVLLGGGPDVVNIVVAIYIYIRACLEAPHGPLVLWIEQSRPSNRPRVSSSSQWTASTKDQDKSQVNRFSFLIWVWIAHPSPNYVSARPPGGCRWKPAR